MTKKWSNINLPGALHYVTGNIIHRLPIFKQDLSCLTFYLNSGNPLPVDHNWWWPEDSEKLSKAIKELGWKTPQDWGIKK